MTVSNYIRSSCPVKHLTTYAVVSSELYPPRLVLFNDDVVSVVVFFVFSSTYPVPVLECHTQDRQGGELWFTAVVVLAAVVSVVVVNQIYPDDAAVGQK